MNLVKALEILDGNSRVLCPQITCEEARGIAELLREQRMVNWDLDAGQNMMEEHIAKVEKERDEARAEVERLRAPVVHCSICNSLVHSTASHPLNSVPTNTVDKPGCSCGRPGIVIGGFCTACNLERARNGMFDASDYEKPRKK